MSERYDIVIVGAGMAGASLAAMVAPHASVLMIETEERPGYHATGRSAAFWEETYGGPGVYPLTAASGPFLRDGGFLSPRGALNIGRESDRAKVEAFVKRFAALGADVELLGRDEIEARVPGLAEEWTCAAWEAPCSDIDVAALHQHYLTAAKKTGAALRTRAELKAAYCEADGWRLDLADGSQVACDTLVNAAGAWADSVAEIAGAAPIGIEPLRRTVVQLRTRPEVPNDVPLVLDINETFYFKPEAGRIWLTPHDETPSAPCDAAPDELDVAIAIERMEQVIGWEVEAVERKWAGLRSFAPDRLPVYGFDAKVPGFFWCAGQGGFGIQTAPAGAALAAQLLLGKRVSSIADGIDPSPYDPARFAMN
ncbi:NAD(P)/FAD-dependent oxidoreductase [Croceicoccus naphthovorans]|uniref:FAD-dependent oxidoreductase n=1 Tax=Croceicoccus naphthovorans TaxID=1348774 RepID=A0A0G3XKT4_9SPHN|nr:FAD-dependent oxidoreductase [Croceicoccus naphthovorans]AKM11852.1 FAD-dependent oxidoreductase [Croceicoccus naphthovorans]MBB3988995.1 D-arginine dehydrogenase [Croceicoccus naphthovorans]